MKRINFLYLLVIPLAYIWIQMFGEMSNTSAFFYGFAENKETELSHDKSVLIKKVVVSPGQEVTKGQVLIEMQQASIDFKIENVNHDLESLDLQARQQSQQLLSRKAQLKAKRELKIKSIQLEIQELEGNIQFQKDLIKDLKSIDTTKSNSTSNPSQIRLTTLKEKLKTAVQIIDVELLQIDKELAQINKPTFVQKNKLKNEQAYYQQQLEQLKILAPSDGLIGNILCKEGENISAFSKLINFYESNPTIVKGFVHESLILQVKRGDSLQVSSTLHPSHHIKGYVIGLGSRIVEIPERLRKIPDFKTYGREVLIQIPANNPFLQKEKVILNTINGTKNESMATLLSFFKLGNQKKEKQIEKSITSQ